MARGHSLSTVAYRGTTCSASRNVERQTAIFALQFVCHRVCLSRFISFQILFLILVKNTIFHFQNYMEHRQLKNIVHLYKRSQVVDHMEFPSMQQASMLQIPVKVSSALCGKQRVIYAARKLKYDEMERLNRIVDLVQYSCGSIMKDIECSSRDQELIGTVYI